MLLVGLMILGTTGTGLAERSDDGNAYTPHARIGQSGVVGQSNDERITANERIPVGTALSPGEVLTNKFVEDLGEHPDFAQGDFRITLEAIGMPYSYVTERTSPIQYDIVFVLDYSHSMESNNKYSNMITAAMQSMNRMLFNNTPAYYNRISVVRYGDIGERIFPRNSDWYGRVPSERYISEADLQGATSGQFTNIMAGMNMAWQILERRSSYEQANRVPIIVLMTDGQPNRHYANFSNRYMTGAASRVNSTQGVYADLQSVQNTILNMAYIKLSIPNLQLFTIGFDLENVSNAGAHLNTLQGRAMQVALARATINPTHDTLNANVPNQSANMRTLRTNIDAGLASTAFAAFGNPTFASISPIVDKHLSASDDPSDILRAFNTIIETINDNNPINGSIRFVDMIDTAFELDMNSFELNGVGVSNIPSGVSFDETQGKLVWEFSDIYRLPFVSAYTNGVVGEGRSYISFIVSLRAEYAVTIPNSGREFFTNTGDYMLGGNNVVFMPMSNNPFFSGSQVNADGSVSQPLLTSGVVVVSTIYIPEEMDLPVQLEKFFQGEWGEFYAYANDEEIETLEFVFELFFRDGAVDTVIDSYVLVLTVQEIISLMQHGSAMPIGLVVPAFYIAAGYDIFIREVLDLGDWDNNWEDDEVRLVSIPALGGWGGFVYTFLPPMTNAFRGYDVPPVQMPEPRSVSVYVQKLWEADGEIPESVEFILLEGGLDGVEFDRKLATAPAWSVEWNYLHADGRWHVVENVPEGFDEAFALEICPDTSNLNFEFTNTQHPPLPQPVQPSQVSVTAEKNWVGEGPHPSSVIFRLLRGGANGIEEGRLTASETTGWVVNWNISETDVNWYIDEIVPDGYTMTYTHQVLDDEHILFVFTNTQAPPEQAPPPGDTWSGPATTSPPTPVPAEPTPDTSRFFSPYHNAFIIGFPDNTVRPHGSFTRAEAVTVLFRLLNDDFREEIWSQQNDFSDVISTNWHNNAISTMANAGIVRGVADGEFRSNEAVTRAEFAAMIARLFSEFVPSENAFSDIEGNWAEDYINLLAQFGWVQGVGGGEFNPNAPLARNEASAIITRMLDRELAGPEGLLDGRIRWPDKTDMSAWYYLYMQEATHSTLFERTENGRLLWTQLLSHLYWEVLERPHSIPEEIRTERLVQRGN